MNKYRAPLGGTIYDAVPEVQALMILDGVEHGLILFNGLEVPVSVNSNPRDISIIQGLMHELRWFENHTGKKAFNS